MGIRRIGCQLSPRGGAGAAVVVDQTTLALHPHVNTTLLTAGCSMLSMVVESPNALLSGYCYLPRSISTSAKPLEIEPNSPCTPRQRHTDLVLAAVVVDH